MNATIPNIQGGTGGTIQASDYAQSGAIPIMGANGELSGAKHIMTALQNSGYMKGGYLASTSAFTIDNSTYNALFFEFDCTSGALAPVPITAVGNAGQLFVFKKTDATVNACTVTPGGGQTIDGAATVVLTEKNDVVAIYSDGTNYKVAWRTRPVSGTLFVQTVATAAITGTNAETAFDSSAQYTIPANSLKVGDVIRIRSQGIVTGHNGSDTLNVKAKIGTTVLGSTGATNNAANDTFTFEIDVTIRTIGASGTFVVVGKVCDGVPGTATVKDFFLASTAIDTTATQLLSLTGTWSSSSGTNSARNDVFIIRREAV